MHMRMSLLYPHVFYHIKYMYSCCHTLIIIVVVVVVVVALIIIVLLLLYHINRAMYIFDGTQYNSKGVY